MRHLLTLKDLSTKEIENIISQAQILKKNPINQKLKQKTILMLFAKPSLRTRISFETGMTQLGGHAIYYDISTSPMGKGETIQDTAKASTRYVDIVMARLYEHSDLEEFAKNSNVPVINALTNFAHPCQILSDLLTIKEKLKTLKGKKLTYLGDGNNNVTHSLLYGCSKMGINISVASPKGYQPNKTVIEESIAFAKNTTVEITDNPNQAIKNADIVYTDSWMSYQIPKEQEPNRIKVFKPYQVTTDLMKKSNNAIFMNCLPAKRGYEQTAEVIDGKSSVVFDQAENRLHAQKALILFLLKK